MATLVERWAMRLTHGFDDEGRQFDAQGNLRDWWTDEDGKEFTKRVACISDQYSGYTVIDDIKINGKLTLGEDVADVGGLILAYMAWKQDTQGQNPQPIDGLTPDQDSSWGTAKAGARTSATKPNECAQQSIRTRRRNTAPTELFQICRSFSRHSIANPDRQW